MFTGLIEDQGRLAALDSTDDGAVLRIESPLGAELQPGDSVAVDGTCLTATESWAGGFAVQAVSQTLRLTALGRAEPGDRLNLELAARLGDRLGGHLVQGHVDGVATVAGVSEEGFSRRLRVELPAGLERYVAEHGSVTLNGASLTVAAVGDGPPGWLEVVLIPETLERTNLGGAGEGSALNLECDLVARYLERLTAGQEG